MPDYNPDTEWLEYTNELEDDQAELDRMAAEEAQLTIIFESHDRIQAELAAVADTNVQDTSGGTVSEDDPINL